jgi:hypothetical protein
LERAAWYLFPAFMNGFSKRPPPATTPTVARQRGSKSLISPEGSWTVAFPRSWAMRTAWVPEDLENFPPSPGLDSTL